MSQGSCASQGRMVSVKNGRARGSGPREGKLGEGKSWAWSSQSMREGRLLRVNRAGAELVSAEVAYDAGRDPREVAKCGSRVYLADRPARPGF